MAKHTPGPWRIGTSGGSVVCDTPVRAGPKTSEDESERLYYGGYLVAESIAPQNRPLIAAAPDLLAACRLGDGLGNEGPYLLEYAADLLEPFAPPTANELRRKARAEAEAIGAATDGGAGNA